MSTATAIPIPPATVRPAHPSPPGDLARELRRLHGRAGQLVADTPWTTDVERAVHDLAVEIRRTIAEASGARTAEPSTPGSGIPPAVRFRELGTLQRRLTAVLRGPVDRERVHEATLRTGALVDALAGRLA